MKSKKTQAHTRYRLSDNSIVPGITTILNLHAKPQLIAWSNKLGLKGVEVGKYVDDLAGIGNLAHAFITDKLIGKETDTSDYSKNQIDTAENCTLSFWEWEKSHKIKDVFFVERPLVSEIFKYGGTMDIYALIDGRRELIDLKTGSGIYEEHIWQVATGRMLLEENGSSVNRTRIVNIPRAETEAFSERVISDKENDTGWAIFKHLLSIYYLKKGLKD
jgi:hypothetical protein